MRIDLGAASKFWEDTRRRMRRLPGKAAQYPCPVSVAYFCNCRVDLDILLLKKNEEKGEDL